MNHMDDSLRDAVLGLASAAQQRYNQFYDNVLYVLATAGYRGDYERCYALQDDAMALCGSPLHKARYDLFNPPTAEETAFLMAFVDGLRAEAKIASEPAEDPDDSVFAWAMKTAQCLDPENRFEQLLECVKYNHLLDVPNPGDAYSVGMIQANDALTAALRTVMSNADLVLVEIDFGIWLYYCGQKEN